MDTPIVPLSLAVPPIWPLTPPVLSASTRIELDLLRLREEISSDPRDGEWATRAEPDTVVNYVGRLLMLRTLDGGDNGDAYWTRFVTRYPIHWACAETNETMTSPTLDMEIVSALTYLASIYARRGEREIELISTARDVSSRDQHVLVAQLAFRACAQALGVRAAYQARILDHSAATESRLCAQLLRIVAWQTQYDGGALVTTAAATANRDHVDEQIALGLGIAAAYWQLVHQAAVAMDATASRCTPIAVAYAHGVLMSCAYGLAQHLERRTSVSDGDGRAEHLYALAVYACRRAMEAIRALSLPERGHLEKMRDDATKGQARMREQRYRQALLFDRATGDTVSHLCAQWESDNAAVFSATTYDLFKVAVAAPPAFVPGDDLAHDTLWTRLVTAGQAWVSLYGGLASFERIRADNSDSHHRCGPVFSRPVLRPADIEARLRADLEGAGVKTYTRREELLTMFGRLHERLAWMEYEVARQSPDSLVTPHELDAVREAIRDLGVTIGKMSTVL